MVGLSGLLFVHRVLGFPHLRIWYEKVVLVIRDGLCAALPVMWLVVSRTSPGFRNETREHPAQATHHNLAPVTTDEGT